MKSIKLKVWAESSETAGVGTPCGYSKGTEIKWKRITFIVNCHFHEESPGVLFNMTKNTYICFMMGLCVVNSSFSCH